MMPSSAWTTILYRINWQAVQSLILVYGHKSRSLSIRQKWPVELLAVAGQMMANIWLLVCSMVASV